MLKRVMLFVITNLAIVFVLSIVLHLLGVGRILDERGVGSISPTWSSSPPSSGSAAR